MKEHKGWHSRGYLPHFDSGDVVQAVTFHLADSLPADVLAQWEEELRGNPQMKREQKRRIERFLDAGHGACWLREPQIARLVQGAFWHWDGERYRLLAWVVMPNHVHVLIESWEGFPLSSILNSWKSFTARQANSLLGRSGPFWQLDYFDRYVRDETHLARVVEYIHNNPVRAGLVPHPAAWPWSSATGGEDGP